MFLDCFAGISFSRWGEKRWLESIERFLPQAGEPPYSTRYPDLADLKTDADVNFISRNLFAHCEGVFLRDGGVEKAAVNAVTDRSIDPRVVCDELLVSAPLPLDEMGPYEHPWRR